MTTLTNKIRDERFFLGGSNTDDDPRFLTEGDYIKAINIEKFYDGGRGIIVNARGNSELSNSNLPSGTNKCIGQTQDNKNNSIIFFNYNSNNNHGIYRFVKGSSVFQKILHNESVLGFVSDCRNLQAEIIGGLLYWNEGKDSNGDYINVPRKINIEKARRFTNSLGGDAYTDITEDVMSVIKRPYLGYLNAVFTHDSALSSENRFIERVYYKFTIQLVYDDSESSVLGSYSNLVERIYDDDNYIGIRFLYNSIDDTVKNIKIYAIKNFVETPFLIEDIELESFNNVYDANDNNAVSSLVDGNYYVYRFYTNETGVAYDDNTDTFDSVPVFANSMTITDDRLMYGQVELGGLDLGESSDGDSIYAPLRRTTAIYDWTAYTSSIIDTATTYSIDVEDILPALTDFIEENSTHFMTTIWKGSATVSASSNGYVSFHLEIDCRKIAPYWSFDKKVEYITDNSEVYVLDGSGNRTDGVFSNGSIGFEELTLRGTVTDDGNLSGFTVVTNMYRIDKANNLAYKSKSNRTFAVIYFDRFGRTLGYQSTTGSLTNETLPNANFDIGTTYPYEETTFLYTFGANLPVPISLGDIYYASIVVSDNLDFINSWQLKEPSSQVVDDELFIDAPPSYDFIEGDKLRVISIDPGGREDKLWDVLGLDSGLLNVDPECDFNSNYPAYSDSIEVLRLNKSDDIIYNELRTWDVGSGSVPLDNFAGIYLSDGDVWLNIDDEAGTVYEQFDDDEGNHIRQTGRPFIERTIFDVTEFKYVYFSNKYFPNTQINGLSTFVSGNRVELDDRKGDIVELKRLGEVLYIHQKNEITSFYLGKTIIKESSGGEIIADTSKVLGGKRESAFSYGTIFQTGQVNNNIYGFDIHEGIFWMNGYNGVKVISGKDTSVNYRMDKYFKDKSQALLVSGVNNVDVLIGVDKANESIFVTFIDSITPANNETISYHLSSNRWISTYSFIPSEYAWLDDKMYSFDTGKMYEHNDSTADRCNFYGQQYNSSLQFVSNKVANEIKVFNNIAVYSNDQWDIDADDAITIPAKENYREQGAYIFKSQSSKIFSGNWRLEEGIYRSEFLRDGKTTSNAIKLIDIYNGALLRGEYLDITMTNDNTDETRLFKVAIDSEMTK